MTETEVQSVEQTNEVAVAQASGEAAKPRKKTVDSKTFVQTWAEVHKAGGSLQDVATKLNMEKSAVSGRSTILKGKGVHLPPLVRQTRKTNSGELNALLSESGIDVEAVAVAEAKRAAEQQA